MKAALITALALGLCFSLPAQNATLAWAKRAGGGMTDDGLGVAVDANGNTFVTGHFRQTATFGAGDPNPTLVTAFGQDVFVAKYAPGGGLAWVRQVKSQNGLGTAIGVDAAGNCYVFGYFTISVIFADGQPEEVTLNALANDLFLAK